MILIGSMVGMTWPALAAGPSCQQKWVSQPPPGSFVMICTGEDGGGSGEGARGGKVRPYGGLELQSAGDRAALRLRQVNQDNLIGPPSHSRRRGPRHLVRRRALNRDPFSLFIAFDLGPRFG